MKKCDCSPKFFVSCQDMGINKDLGVAATAHKNVRRIRSVTSPFLPGVQILKSKFLTQNQAKNSKLRCKYWKMGQNTTKTKFQKQTCNEQFRPIHQISANVLSLVGSGKTKERFRVFVKVLFQTKRKFETKFHVRRSHCRPSP